MRILDYSYHFDDEYNIEGGIITDAIGIKKYTEKGPPNLIFREKFPAIYIERQFGENICLLFKHKSNRDTVYNNLAEQLKEENKCESETV